ncbi:ORM1-like protein 3 isoform X1 [Dioscorea cayenensis subsp. rotundata]|uniref:ORM1-like protein 3 isoform X1 n=1 Tax=Dioscorea cayennensis subsp. rotundata TaxID=55577 RepID=A0AB40CVH4_DIOCR|nr:ORM1-like protein 3 isoform X1 [Dioscorea cayenensis subsp. rotundata]
MAKLYMQTVPPPDLNKNTEWFMYPGVWTTYILILFFSWLIVLSVFGCTPGMAWTLVNLFHFSVTYYFFHWKKGTPFSEDQGIYNNRTWWEQIDNGKQLTRNRKFLTVVPCCPVLDRLAYNRLPVPMDHPEHTCRIRSSGCQATEHAQGPHLRNQCRLVRAVYKGNNLG